MTINKKILVDKINSFSAGKLKNKSPNTNKLVYSSQNPYGGIGDAGIWVRNPFCWLNGVSNISCFSPAQRSGAAWNQRAGTLITKKHFILGKHFVFAILSGGTPIIFVDENNNAIKRNLIQYAYDDLTDIAIGLLDSEVPNNIKVAKVLPPNYQDYMGYPKDLLAVALDQEEKALIKVWAGLLNYTTAGGSYQYVNAVSAGVNYVSSSLNSYSIWNEDMISGDSGNPIFLIINNELVLLACWHTPWSGPFITNRYNKVNELINDLSPNEGYSLTNVDLEAAYNNMPKRYFLDTGDGDWNNLANWWQDQNHTVPVMATPIGTDIPILPWTNNVERVMLGSSMLSTAG